MSARAIVSARATVAGVARCGNRFPAAVYYCGDGSNNRVARQGCTNQSWVSPEPAAMRHEQREAVRTAFWIATNGAVTLAIDWQNNITGDRWEFRPAAEKQYGWYQQTGAWPFAISIAFRVESRKPNALTSGVADEAATADPTGPPTRRVCPSYERCQVVCHRQTDIDIDPLIRVHPHGA